MWLVLTGKHLLHWSLFLILSIVKFFRAFILKNISKRLLLKMSLYKKKFFQHQYQKQVKMFAFISWLVSCEVCIHSHTIFLRIYFFGMVINTKTLNTKYLLQLIKRRSKVQKTNISCEHALNLDQWKLFSEKL